MSSFTSQRNDHPTRILAAQFEALIMPPSSGPDKTLKASGFEAMRTNNPDQLRSFAEQLRQAAALAEQYAAAIVADHQEP